MIKTLGVDQALYITHMHAQIVFIILMGFKNVIKKDKAFDELIHN